MKCATRKLRPPLKRHGGKTYLARRLIALMPDHKHYLELFAGGLSVLLNKTTPGAELVNDLDADLVHFWRTLRDEPGFLTAVRQPYSAETFAEAEGWLTSTFPLDRAAGYMIRNRMSRGGLGKDFAWSDRLRGGQPGDVNAWQTILADLPAIKERLQGVNVMGVDCLTALGHARVGPDTLVYADPPYLPETRSVKKAYAHEMSLGHHVALLDALIACEGKVMLSGYESPLYNDRLGGWNRHDFSMPNHSGQGKVKQRRVECVWTNF